MPYVKKAKIVLYSREEGGTGPLFPVIAADVDLAAVRGNPTYPNDWEVVSDVWARWNDRNGREKALIHRGKILLPKLAGEMAAFAEERGFPGEARPDKPGFLAAIWPEVGEPLFVRYTDSFAEEFGGKPQEAPELDRPDW